ncbi:MAG: hypothetical protein V1645_03840 [archaeon]
MEKKVLELIAQDRIDIPLSSMEQKLRKVKMSNAGELADVVGTGFYGERSFAYVSFEDKNRARGMKEAIAEFEQEFPKYGAILRGLIAEKRVKREEHLYFGLNSGCKLTGDDYMGVMKSVGLSDTTSRSLYPDLMDVSRKLSKARNEDRSLIVGKYEED